MAALTHFRQTFVLRLPNKHFDYVTLGDVVS